MKLPAYELAEQPTLLHAATRQAHVAVGRTLILAFVPEISHGPYCVQIPPFKMKKYN
jgi:hypothetical protein